MMDIEIDYRDPLQPPRGAGVRGGDRDVVEQAEAHRTGGLGMVTRGTDSDEGVLDSTGKHLVHCQHSAAGGDGSGAGAAMADRRVGIKLQTVARLRLQGKDRFDIGLGVNARDLLNGCFRRLKADEGRKIAMRQCRQNGPQPLRTFRMTVPGIVIQAVKMGDQRGSQAPSSLA